MQAPLPPPAPVGQGTSCQEEAPLQESSAAAIAIASASATASVSVSVSALAATSSVFPSAYRTQLQLIKSELPPIMTTSSEAIQDHSSCGTLTAHPEGLADQEPGPGGGASEPEDGGSQHPWDLEETLILVAAKKQLDDELDEKQLSKVIRNKNQRWQFVSQLCAKQGVLRTSTQCLNRWNRIWREFKNVFDYEQHIPPGHHSYFAMKPNDRASRKLPRNMELRLYEAMASRFAGAVNRADGFLDTSAAILARPENMVLPSEDAVPARESPALLQEEGEQSSEKEQTSGKKRVRPARVSVMGKDLQDTNKRLLDLYGSVETDRAKWQKELLDIARDESEANARIARERLATEKERLEIEKQTNVAFFEIANAIRSLTSAIGNK